MINLVLFVLNSQHRYLNWIRRKKDQKEELRQDLERREKTLQNHPEFNEIHEDDLEMISSFRSALGLKKKPLKVEPIEDENSTVDEESVDKVSDLLSTPNTANSNNSLSRGSSLGSVRSKLSSIRSDLSPLPEVERESSSPSNAPTPAAASATVEDHEDKSLETELQTSKSEIEDIETQSTLEGRTQSLVEQDETRSSENETESG